MEWQCPKCKLRLGCNCKLPHSFDLLFDIKTFDKLAQEYVDVSERLKLLEEYCKEYEINTDILRNNVRQQEG